MNTSYLVLVKVEQMINTKTVNNMLLQAVMAGLQQCCLYSCRH